MNARCDLCSRVSTGELDYCPTHVGHTAPVDRLADRIAMLETLGARISVSDMPGSSSIERASYEHEPARYVVRRPHRGYLTFHRSQEFYGPSAAWYAARHALNGYSEPIGPETLEDIYRADPSGFC